ncbi:hypothetical protein ABE607_00855 [Comamonas aquatica]|uniref:hypothetical protein n=1 Tax=Comamonas aquatica TaxID=225991 RepID=UPI003209FB4D
MANFSAEFPIDTKNTVNDVLNLACTWITGSPHTNFTKSDIGEMPEEGEKTISINDNQIVIAKSKSDNSEIAGLKYTRTENQLQWTTSIVSLKNCDKHHLSIEVVCKALNTIARLPPPKKPYFIWQALNALGGGSDGEIPVSQKPFNLNEDEASIALALINGTANNTLPIVYVSSPYNKRNCINTDELARLVCGLAHVVVEPSRNFSAKLKDLTQSKNVYGGDVGIYWPKSRARTIYRWKDNNPRSLMLEIAKEIRVALSNRRQLTPCTWLNLKEAVAKNRFEQLKSIGSTEINEYIAAFDADISAKEARLAEVQEECSRLLAENRRLSASISSSTRGLLNHGDEQDLYENEITDIVIDALKEALRGARQGSRRSHVLEDLLYHNEASGNGALLEGEIRAILRTYEGLDSKTKGALTKLGFEITDDGKHYKAVFQGDGRYTFALSKSISDHRTGKNLVSDIKNTIF